MSVLFRFSAASENERQKVAVVSAGTGDYTRILLVTSPKTSNAEVAA
jgi:hypothetical protein